MAGLFALTTAAIFFGAAFYVSFAEQPARLGLDARAALTQWAPSYRRGLQMQGSLALCSGLLGLGAWIVEGGAFWGGGAIAILANWPYTLLAIMPVNHRLEATPPEAADAETRELLTRWGRLHSVRAAFGGLATLFYFIAALRLF
jgi:hypothetical protein